MPKLSFFKILSVIGAINKWAMEAFVDGKIDSVEASELVNVVCDAIGVKAEIQLPE